MHLLHDRYVVMGESARDLVSGAISNLDEIDASDVADERGFGALIELFEHGRDGAPRWIVAAARSSRDIAVIRRRAAAVARRHGFVAIGVDVYHGVARQLAGALKERPLLLLGGPAASRPAELVLVDAAARSSRPHVLMTFEIATASARAALHVREARAAFGSARPAAPSAATERISPDLNPQITHREQALTMAAAGRHAAACRMLREVAGALTRRRAYGQAVQTLLRLIELLLDRGQTDAAAAVVREAAKLVSDSGESACAFGVRWWEAYVKMQRRQFTDAESIARALLLTAGDPVSAAAANVLTVMCLLEQGRHDEARRVVLSIDLADELPLWLAPLLYDAATVVAIADGRLFDAGQIARRAIAWFELPLHRSGLLEARISQLRVLCATGDFVLADNHWRDIHRLARDLHRPMQAARARVLLLALYTRLGDSRRATPHARALSRVQAIAGPLLAEAIRVAAIPAAPTDASVRVAAPAALGDLVRVMYDEADDLAAIRLAAERLSAELRTSRVDVFAVDNGVASPVTRVGAGPDTQLSARIIESGMAIGFGGGREAGIPVRRGRHLLGAIVVRWPVDRVQPEHAESLFALVAALAAPRLEGLLEHVRAAAVAATEVPELIGEGAAMSELRKAITRAARAPFAVLLEGESGTGKELVARAIHHLGPRRQRRFCDVNCAALPDDLLETELFGHAKGAFTGAVADRAGLFEEATGGTLFLDEVADLSARGQAKLLRAVQQQEVRRVGETMARIIDVRFVAAANRDLAHEAEMGTFRRDLLYRLNVIRIRIPPLRERLEDVPGLALHFWKGATERVGSRAVLSAEVVADLARYHWPGNVRELQNVIAALAVAAPPRGRVHRRQLPATIGGAQTTTTLRLAEARDQFERRFVEIALAQAGGNRTHAARALGLTRQGLLKTLARLGIRASVDAEGAATADTKGGLTIQRRSASRSVG